MRVARIVFMQGEEGRDVVDALTRCTDGTIHRGATSETIAAAIAHLSQWDYGDDDDVHDTFSAGTRDNVVTCQDTGYTLTFNVGLGYVGLERQLLDCHDMFGAHSDDRVNVYRGRETADLMCGRHASELTS